MHRFLLILLLLFGAPWARAKVYRTQEKVSIDRCASAWFISRFVDPSAEFVFCKAGAEDAVQADESFGYFGSTYFNQGQDSTFIVLLKAKNLTGDPALRKIAELTNDATGWRYGPISDQSTLLRHVADLREKLPSDAAVVEKMMLLFDWMFIHFEGTSKPLQPINPTQSLLKRWEINSTGDRMEKLSAHDLDLAFSNRVDPSATNAWITRFDAQFLSNLKRD